MQDVVILVGAQPKSSSANSTPQCSKPASTAVCSSLTIAPAIRHTPPFITADACTLLREALRNESSEVIFAARSKRLESLLFRSLYQVYRALHLALTGNAVRVGNFS